MIRNRVIMPRDRTTLDWRSASVHAVAVPIQSIELYDIFVEVSLWNHKIGELGIGQDIENTTENNMAIDA